MSESPHEVELWIKLAELKLVQKSESEEITDQLNERNLRQALSILSRGLEANRNAEVSTTAILLLNFQKPKLSIFKEIVLPNLLNNEYLLNLLFKTNKIVTSRAPHIRCHKF